MLFLFIIHLKINIKPSLKKNIEYDDSVVDSSYFSEKLWRAYYYMNTYQIDQIEDFSTFSQDVYLDKKFILLPSHIPLDAKLKEKLIETAFVNIYSEGEVEALGEKKEENAKAEAEEVKKEDEAVISEEEEKEKEEIVEIEKIYIEHLLYIANVYFTYAASQKLDVENIFAKAKEICEFVRKYRHKILGLAEKDFKEVESAIILHIMRTTVFTVIIALQVKMPENRVIEITVASMMHKIGFLRLPPQLYDGNNSLNDRELKTFKSHPVVSYRILKDASFPATVCAGVLEQHEREDGSGYPRGLKSEEISIFGKILSVACSFEASTGDFKGCYGVNSVLDVVRNSNKQYSDIILKSLLFSISVFPIGTFVQLSDKRIGQVVDINPDNLAYPVVLIYGDLSAQGEVKVVKTSPNGITIKKPLTKAEIDEVKRTRSGFLPSSRA